MFLSSYVTIVLQPKLGNSEEGKCLYYLISLWKCKIFHKEISLLFLKLLRNSFCVVIFLQSYKVRNNMSIVLKKIDLLHLTFKEYLLSSY